MVIREPIRIRICSLIALVAVLGFPGANALAQQQGHIPNDVVASIRERVDNGQNVGIIVGVVGPGVEQYFGYGRTVAGGDDVPDEHTVFEIGSISKVFTGLLLADMVERGHVGLDDPVRRFLPESVTMPKRGDREITLEDLSTHMSGLPRLPYNMAPEDSSNPYADYTVDQMYAFLSNHTLRRDIGSQYEYSNLAVGLLGHVLSLKAGMSYEALLSSRILDPLGMHETGITLSSDMQARLARGHAGGELVSNWDIPTLAGAGAIRSTAHDMLRFLSANMDLKNAPASVSVETNPLIDAMHLSHEIHADHVAGTMSVGLGWHIRPGNGVVSIWHNGGTGGYRSFAGFNTDGDFGFVVLTNSTTSADDIGFHLLDPSFPLVEVEESGFPEVVELSPESLDAYVGRYELAPSFVLTITRENIVLKAQATGQPAFTIYPSSETEFFWKVVDAQLTFIVDDDGNVVSLVLHQNGADLPGRRINE